MNETEVDFTGFGDIIGPGCSHLRIEEKLIILDRYDNSSDDILFGYLDGDGRGLGILGFDRRFWIGTRTGSRSWIDRFFPTTGHEEEGHQERSGQGFEDIQDSE